MAQIAKRWGEIEALGAQVVLVSPQDEDHTRKLAARHGVGFRYLRDEGRIVYADQTDNYRVRPMPETVLDALRLAGLAPAEPAQPGRLLASHTRSDAFSSLPGVSGWRQARAIAVLPGNVTLVVPALILLLGSGPNVGWGLGPPLSVLAVLLGIVLIASGFAVWLWTVRLFNRIGKGTLAAWDPTSALVVEGPYRHMRNPMITAVATLLVGEAILFGSLWILAWAGLFLAINYAYFLFAEEPGLERRFGDEYRAYKRDVPRWIPRRTPWHRP